MENGEELITEVRRVSPKYAKVGNFRKKKGF